MPSLPYLAHDSFVRAAAARQEIWRVLVMALTFEGAFWIGPTLVAAILPAPLRAAYVNGTSAFGTLMQFADFTVIALIFLWVLRRVHDRGLWSLIGQPDVAAADLIRTAVNVGLVLLAVELLTILWASVNAVETMALPIWIALLPLALVALFVQVSTEELFFRGYLQQQLACRFRSPIVWMGLPSLAFGLSHYANGIGPADTLLYVTWAAALGLACADLTARTGTLGAAIGLHLANNAFALLIFGISGWPLSGLALFLLPDFDPADYDYSLHALVSPGGLLEIIVSLGTVFVIWLAARIAIRR